MFIITLILNGKSLNLRICVKEIYIQFSVDYTSCPVNDYIT